MTHFLERLTKQYGTTPADTSVGPVQPLIASRFSPGSIAGPSATIGSLNDSRLNDSPLSHSSKLSVAVQPSEHAAPASSEIAPRTATGADGVAHHSDGLSSPRAATSVPKAIAALTLNHSPFTASSSAIAKETRASENQLHPAAFAQPQAKIEQTPQTRKQASVPNQSNHQLAQSEQTSNGVSVPVLQASEPKRHNRQKSTATDFAGIVAQVDDIANLEKSSSTTSGSKISEQKALSVEMHTIGRERKTLSEIVNSQNISPVQPVLNEMPFCDTASLQQPPTQKQPSQPTTIQVSIGRIEVRTAPQLRPAITHQSAALMPQPERSLASYLNKRRR